MIQLWGLMLRQVERDIEQLSRLRNGDEEAFVMLVGRYRRPVLRLARSMVSSDAVAEEVVQDTWLGVVRSIDEFEGRSSFRTWLYRILVNRAALGRLQGASQHADRFAACGRFDPIDAQGQWAIHLNGGGRTAKPTRCRFVDTNPRICARRPPRHVSGSRHLPQCRGTLE